MVVIDGATKNIDNLKEYFSSKDKRIRFVNITHGGVSVARNYGITHTDGKYIVFVDSDDYIELDTIEKAYRRAIECRADVVYYGYNIVSAEGIVTKTYKPEI